MSWPGDDLTDTIRDLVLLALPNRPEQHEDPDLDSERAELEAEFLDDARSVLEHELSERVDTIDATDADLGDRGSDADTSMEEVAIGDELPPEAYGLPTRLLVDQIGVLAARRAALNTEIAVMIAYAREFVEDPPSLAQLAAVAGMSVSGVRTAFGEAERAEVARRLHRPPVRGRLAPLWRGESSPRGTLLGVDETGSWVSVPLAEHPMLLLDAASTPTMQGLLAVIRGQAAARGWNTHQVSAAELHAAAAEGELPRALTAAGPSTDALVEVTDTDPAASTAADPAGAAKSVSLLAAHPCLHLVWASARPEVHAALEGRAVILRRPSRRHEQFWTLDVPGLATQRVRPARPDSAAEPSEG